MHMLPLSRILLPLYIYTIIHCIEFPGRVLLYYVHFYKPEFNYKSAVANNKEDRFRKKNEKWLNTSEI